MRTARLTSRLSAPYGTATRCWFQTADRTHKAKNIVRDQRCAVSVSLDGCDVVVEGTAEKVTDPDDVARIAEIFHTRGGWPATPDESGTVSPHHSTRPGSARRRGSSTASRRQPATVGVDIARRRRLDSLDVLTVQTGASNRRSGWCIGGW